MVDFDFLQIGTILTISGIAVAIYFNSLKERRERRNERLAEADRAKKEKEQVAEREETQRKVFAQQVKETVENQANLLNQRLDDKLEVIHVTTSGLKSNFEEFKSVNRDEILSIKREIEKLKEEANHLNRQVQANEIDRMEVENRMNTINSKIQGLEERIKSVEVRVSNHQGVSSTR